MVDGIIALPFHITAISEGRLHGIALLEAFGGTLQHKIVFDTTFARCS